MYLFIDGIGVKSKLFVWRLGPSYTIRPLSSWLINYVFMQTMTRVHMHMHAQFQLYIDHINYLSQRRIHRELMGQVN